ncbi:MAG TPA: hypothetical protein VF883_16880 [Thermoanaerobaculia bacterium]|jgi:tetratricopeptide (TPR) repeat protein
MIARIAAVVIAALLGVWALVRFVYVPHRCNAGITAAEVATAAAEQTAADYDRLLRARRNLEVLAGLRESCATEVRVPMLTGANLEFVGRAEDALASYKEALRVDQRPEIYVEVARMQLELGQVDEAVASYVTATRYSPLVLDGIASEEVRRRVREQLDARR